MYDVRLCVYSSIWMFCVCINVKYCEMEYSTVMNSESTVTSCCCCYCSSCRCFFRSCWCCCFLCLFNNFNLRTFGSKFVRHFFKRAIFGTTTTAPAEAPSMIDERLIWLKRREREKKQPRKSIFDCCAHADGGTMVMWHKIPMSFNLIIFSSVAICYKKSI